MSRYTKNPILDYLPEINKMKEYDKSYIAQKYDGFCSEVKSEKEARIFIKKERATFKKYGYLLYAFSDNDHKLYVAAMKTTDEIDILRWRGTDGINYNLTNADIIYKLQMWSKDNPIEIYNVSFDLVEFYFEDSIIDANKLAKEVYDFCPDAVNQGVGSMEEMENVIKSINGVYLWWD